MPPYFTLELPHAEKLAVLRAAFTAGMLSRRTAWHWASKLTEGLSYNCSDPQDRAAMAYITGRRKHPAYQVEAGHDVDHPVILVTAWGDPVCCN